MPSPEVVATGKINIVGEIKGQGNGVVISGGEITEKAYRRCPAGSAACGFAGIELGDTAADGSVEVSTMCERPDSCQTNSESLQIGLDRLRDTAPAAIIPKDN